ncbi:MAG: hypothetical protein LBC71_01330 [Oscillospiraceae bacterium]|jgi:hypothetical protein|nr:hypothetical protein [Oscillospiraceae bacterium]
MMNKRVKIIILTLVMIIILIPLGFVIKKLYFPVIYPVKSTPQELTIVLYRGFHHNSPIITLRHYIGDLHIADYTLVIENGIGAEETQNYRLPRFEEGTVEINIDLRDRMDSRSTPISLIYDNAEELYQRGLLIYITTDGSGRSIVDDNNLVIEHVYDRYVHFVSGQDRKCFLKEKYSSEWVLTSNAPSLKRLPAKYSGPQLPPYYSGWRENEWIVD